MLEYNNLCLRILDTGEVRKDRTGVGTVSVFGEKLVFNLLKGLPVVTSKKIAVITAIKELLWMLSGSSSNNDLVLNNVHIWDEWKTEDGNLGPIYGSQWRNWISSNGSIDQISLLVNGLKNNPFSRRHILNAWNCAFIPDETLSPQENVKLGKMCLPPCHMMAQWYVLKATDQDKKDYLEYMQSIGEEPENIPEYKLNCQMYMRSNDVVLGLPFNLIGYSVLTMMLAKQCGYMPGYYHHVIGDAHIYLNHIDNLKKQLERGSYPLPYLKILNGVDSIDNYKIDHFKLINYKHHDPIYYDVAI